PPRPTPLPYTTLFRSIDAFDLANKNFSEMVSKYVGQQNSSLSSSLRSFDETFAEVTTKLNSSLGNLNVLMNDFIEKMAAIEKYRSEEHTSELQSPYDL